MNIFNNLIPSYNTAHETKKPDDTNSTLKAERDACNLTNNLVRQALGHYRSEDTAFPLQELEERALSLILEKKEVAAIAAKVQEYLVKRYPDKCAGIDELKKKVLARLNRCRLVFNSLANSPASIVYEPGQLRAAIGHELKINSNPTGQTAG